MRRAFVVLLVVVGFLTMASWRIALGQPGSQEAGFAAFVLTAAFAGLLATLLLKQSWGPASRSIPFRVARVWRDDFRAWLDKKDRGRGDPTA